MSLCYTHTYIYKVHNTCVYTVRKAFNYVTTFLSTECLLCGVNRIDLLYMWVTLLGSQLLPVQHCLVNCRGRWITSEVGDCMKSHCFSRKWNSSLRKSTGWLLTGIEVSERAPEPPSRKIIRTRLCNSSCYSVWTSLLYMTVKQGIHAGTALKASWKRNQFLARKWSEELVEVNSSDGTSENSLVLVVNLYLAVQSFRVHISTIVFVRQIHKL